MLKVFDDDQESKAGYWEFAVERPPTEDHNTVTVW